jgi:hypothetical protein
MLKRSFAITMAVGALAVGGGAASALADSGDTGSTTTGTTTMTDTPTTVPTTVATPVTVTTPMQGDDVAEHAANDVMAAANGVQNEAIAETDDDDTGDRHGANDDSEESGDHGHHRGHGNGQSGSGQDDNDHSGRSHDGSDDDDSVLSAQSGGE